MNRKIFYSLIFGNLVLLSLLWGFIAIKSLGPNRLTKLNELPYFKMNAITSEANTTIDKTYLQGKPWIAGFIFTRCSGPCPIITMNMARLQKTLPKEVRLVTFTVDPDRDTLEVLQRYAIRFNADPKRWWFLTGDKGELYKLMYEGFNLPIAEDIKAPSDFRIIHSTKLVLVDSKGIIRGYYNGIEDSGLDRIQKDVQKLLMGS